VPHSIRLLATVILLASCARTPPPAPPRPAAPPPDRAALEALAVLYLAAEGTRSLPLTLAPEADGTLWVRMAPHLFSARAEAATDGVHLAAAAGAPVRELVVKDGRTLEVAWREPATEGPRRFVRAELPPLQALLRELRAGARFRNVRHPEKDKGMKKDVSTAELVFRGPLATLRQAGELLACLETAYDPQPAGAGLPEGSHGYVLFGFAWDRDCTTPLAPHQRADNRELEMVAHLDEGGHADAILLVGFMDFAVFFRDGVTFTQDHVRAIRRDLNPIARRAVE